MSELYKAERAQLAKKAVYEVDCPYCRVQRSCECEDMRSPGRHTMRPHPQRVEAAKEWLGRDGD